MRTIIAGSRGCQDIRDLYAAINQCGWAPSVVISGGARGADRLGEVWARENGVGCEVVRAQWDTYGKSAGYKRNQQMATMADALIALWDGESRGTKHMIEIAKRTGLRVHVQRIQPALSGE